MCVHVYVRVLVYMCVCVCMYVCVCACVKRIMKPQNYEEYGRFVCMHVQKGKDTE